MTDQALMDIALVVATQSKCNRKKVGAVITKDKVIVGIGYNGTPTGTCNECETEDNVTKSSVIHAELNATLNASTNNLTGASLYCTLAPCLSCAALIIQKRD